MIRCQDCGCLSGTRGFEKKERMLQMNPRAVGHQQPEPAKIIQRVKQNFRRDRHLLFG